MIIERHDQIALRVLRDVLRDYTERHSAGMIRDTAVALSVILGEAIPWGETAPVDVPPCKSCGEDCAEEDRSNIAAVGQSAAARAELSAIAEALDDFAAKDESHVETIKVLLAEREQAQFERDALKAAKAEADTRGVLDDGSIAHCTVHGCVEAVLRGDRWDCPKCGDPSEVTWLFAEEIAGATRSGGVEEESAEFGPGTPFVQGYMEARAEGSAYLQAERKAATAEADRRVAEAVEAEKNAVLTYLSRCNYRGSWAQGIERNRHRVQSEDAPTTWVCRLDRQHPVGNACCCEMNPLVPGLAEGRAEADRQIKEAVEAEREACIADAHYAARANCNIPDGYLIARGTENVIRLRAERAERKEGK